MPYNSETETFYQAPATVVDSTPDGDTVQEGFDDRLTPAMAGLYADLNLLKADGMISVGIPATTTARGIGRVATAADVAVGSTITNGPAFLDAATWKASADPETSGIIPLTGDGGKIHLKLIGTMLCNVRTVITTSGSFTYPVSGWYRKIAIAAGGAGGSGSISNAFIAGGGGGAGQVKTALEWHNANTSESVVIGAGGTPGAIGAAGSNGGNTTFGGVVAIGGNGGKCSLIGVQACSAGGRGYGSGGPGSGQYITGGGAGVPGTGGVGGSNGTDYGGGGGGGTVWVNGVTGVGGIGTANGLDGSYGASESSAGAGGKGGDGAVIIEYFNPAVTA